MAIEQKGKVLAAGVVELYTSPPLPVEAPLMAKISGSGFTITGGHAIFIDEAVPAGEAVIVAQATALDGGPGRWISMTHLTDELKGFNAVGPGPNIGQARVGFVVLRIR